MDSCPFPHLAWSTTPKRRPPLLASDNYGYKVLSKGKSNYMYQLGSAKTNCRNHLRSKHRETYDKTIVEKNWPYPLSTEDRVDKPNAGELRRQTLPRFTGESFLDYLVRFIVADDQVSFFFTVSLFLSR